MIQALMALALRERIVVIGIALMLLLAGIYSFSQLDIEAYPDPVQPMVEVLTLPNGLSAEEVEKLVTVPTEYGLAGMRDLGCDALDLAVRAVGHPMLLLLGQRLLLGSRRDDQSAVSFITLPQGVTPGNLAGKSDRRNLSLHGREPRSRSDPARKKIEDWILEKQIQDGAGGDRRLGLRRADQAVPRRCRSAAS